MSNIEHRDPEGLAGLASSLAESGELPDLAEASSGFGAGSAGDAENGSTAASSSSLNLDAVMRIPVTIKVVLGTATMPVSSLVKVGRGAIIPLDRRVGEPVDVVVNGRVVARGEVVVMDSDKTRFGLSLTEIVGPALTAKAT